MKKIWAIVLVIVFSVVTMAACGGDDSSTAPDAVAETPADSAPADDAVQGDDPGGAQADSTLIDIDAILAEMGEEAFWDEFENLGSPLQEELDKPGKTVHISGRLARITNNGVFTPRVDIYLSEFDYKLYGLQIYVEGFDADDYPGNHAEIEVTGVLTEPGDLFNDDNGKPQVYSKYLAVAPKDFIVK